MPKLTTQLKPHQLRAINRLQHQNGLILSHGLGTGKTLSSIAASLREKGPTHVVLPAALRDNYRKEIAKHTTGGHSPSIQSIQAAAVHGVPASHLLVVDEAHRARETGSKTHQAVRDAKAHKKLLLTASPTYNRPADIAPLVNIVSGKRTLPTGADFTKRYIKKPPTGWRGLIPGAQKTPHLKNQGELKKVLHKWVDHHEATGGDFPSRQDHYHSVMMTPRQSKIHDMAWGKLGLVSRLRLKRGMTPTKKDVAKMNAFNSQTRQVSASERGFVKHDAANPKVDESFKIFHRAAKKNRAHKGVIYSNYLSSLNDYSDRLTRHGIPHALYTGKVSKKLRDQHVRDYNSGKLKAMLISSAGGEGLDLKGTRHVHVLEPHWNNEKLHQVIGRAIRHGSHSHLPKAERHVDVHHFEAHPRRGLAGRTLGLKKRTGIEQVLRNMSSSKDNLNNELRDLLRHK